MKYLNYDFVKLMKLKQSPEAFEFVYFVAIEKREEDIKNLENILSSHLGTSWTNEDIENFLDNSKETPNKGKFMIPLLLGLRPEEMTKTFEKRIGYVDKKNN